MVLGSIPSEDGFCSSDTKHDRRTAPRRKLFVLKRNCRNKRHNTEMCPGFKS
jgi:hypothetical protein